jgi:hypothetical protein
MKPTTPLTLTLLTLTNHATSTVITGTSQYTTGPLKGTQYDIAWIKGLDACQYTYLANYGVNPCGKRFSLSNGYTYYLTDCGDASFALRNGDGSYNHIGVYKPDYEVSFVGKV